MINPEQEHLEEAEDLNVGVFVAWPYGNGPRHLGHAASLLPGDVLARYYRGVGANVLMVSGTDEYGTPNMIAAEKIEMDTQEFVDTTNEIIRNDFLNLGMSFDWFTRTTSSEHAKNAQNIFAKLVESGHIEKGTMPATYDTVTGQALPDRYVEGGCPVCKSGARGDQCESCTTMLDPSELIEPKSSVTGNAVEFRDAEHYFLRLDLLKDEIEEFLSENTNLRTEARNMSSAMATELKSRAITRDMTWGIPLPEGYELEDDRVLYVWFEAVIGYLSASIEWAKDQGDPNLWETWWRNDDAIHYYTMGKDNVPFHTLVWPGIISAINKADELENSETKLHLPDIIASTGYMNFGEQKFSTSKGNVVYIQDLLEVAGADATRYYFLAAGPENKDVNFSYSEFVRRNNDELIAKWGNMVSRTLSLLHKYNDGNIPEFVGGNLSPEDKALLEEFESSFDVVGTLISEAKFSQAIKHVMGLAGSLNKYTFEAEPWKEYKTNKASANHSMAVISVALHNLNLLMSPFLPHASQRAHELLGGDGTIASLPENYFSSSSQVTVLTGDYQRERGRWRYTESLQEKLGTEKTVHLFKKLDAEEIQTQLTDIQSKRNLGSVAVKSQARAI